MEKSNITIRLEKKEEHQKVENLKGKLIVSCQALSNEPLHSSFIMGRMALAAKQDGKLHRVFAVL